MVNCHQPGQLLRLLRRDNFQNPGSRLPQIQLFCRLGKTMAWLHGTYRFLDCVTYAAYAWDHTMHCLKAIGNGIRHGMPDMTPYGGRYTPVYREPYHHRYDRPVRYSNSRPRIVKTRQLEKRENRRPVRDVRQQDSRKPVRSTVKKQTLSSNSGSTPLLDKYLSRKYKRNPLSFERGFRFFRNLRAAAPCFYCLWPSTLSVLFRRSNHRFVL